MFLGPGLMTSVCFSERTVQELRFNELSRDQSLLTGTRVQLEARR